MPFFRRRRRKEVVEAKAPVEGAPTPARERLASLTARLAGIVERLASLTGISMVMLMGRGGEDIYRWYRTTADMRRFRISTRDVLDLVLRASDLMSKTSTTVLDDVIMRTGDRVAVLQAAGPLYLVVIADRAANLALLLVRSKAAAREIAGLVG